MSLLRVLSFTLVGAFLASPAHAQKHCSDIYTPACTTETGRDVTGFASRDLDDSEVVEQIPLLVQESIATYRKILDRRDGKDLRELALSGFDAKGLMECGPSGSENKCNDKLALELAYFSGSVIYNRIQFPVRRGSIQALEKIAAHPQVQAVRKDLAAKTVDKFLDHKGEAFIRDTLLPDIKIRLKARIAQFDIPDKEKERLQAKITSVQFGGIRCPTAQGKTQVAALLAPNAFYLPSDNKLYICNGLLLRTNSHFSLVYAMAHELAHKIDPCFFDDARSVLRSVSTASERERVEKEYSFTKLLQCLRSKDSIAAQHKPHSHDDEAKKTSKGSEISSFCDRDQVGEAIPDWFAFETVYDYAATLPVKLSPQQAAAGYANVWRPLCSNDNKDRVGFGTHPYMKDRANRLMLAHPGIREQLGCAKVQSPALYCDGKDATPKDPRIVQVKALRKQVVQ